MRTSAIKFVSRLVLGVAALVLILVLANYLAGWRQRSKAVKETPRILGSELIRSVDRIEYTDNRNGVMRFKIRAVRLLEDRMGKSHLEGIEASDFKPDGSVRNQIRSEKAEYDRDHGIARFSGSVRLSFAQGIELTTNSLRYDFSSGIGETPDVISFHWERGFGRARGLRFDQKQGQLDLQDEVEFSFAQERKLSSQKRTVDTFRARARRGSLFQNSRRILLEGEVNLESSSAALQGERVEAFLDPEAMWLNTVIAEGNVACRFREPEQLTLIRGSRIQFGMEASSHALESISAVGEAELFFLSGKTEEKLRGDEIHIKLNPLVGRPKWIEGRSRVRFEARRVNEEVLLSSEYLHAEFMSDSNLIKSLQLSGSARLSMGGTAALSGQELQAKEINISFRSGDNGLALEKLRANGSARWVMRLKSARQQGHAEPDRILEASELEVFYSQEGPFLSRAHARGEVVMFESANNGASAFPMRKLSAREANFDFYPGNNCLKIFRAAGEVRLLYQTEPGAADKNGPERFQTESENIEALFDLIEGASKLRSLTQWDGFRYYDGVRNSAAGRAYYHASNQVIVLKESPIITASFGTTAGEYIEFDRPQKLLTVYNRVRSQLSPKQGQNSLFTESAPNSGGIITADAMRYWIESGRVHYEGNVRLLSENSQLEAEALDILAGGTKITAEGKVSHIVFTSAASNSPGRRDETIKSATKTSEMPMIVKSASLNYLREDRTIVYTGNVVLSYKDLVFYAARLEALLDSAGKRIEQARAQGGVRVRQSERECAGDTADYYLNPERLVIVGSPAVIFDPGKGRSLARRLTSFVADDRILIESQ